MNILQEAILELHKINNTHCFECLGELNVNITKIIKLLQEHEQKNESCKHKIDITVKALEEIANGHLQEQISEMIAKKALKKIR